MSTNINITVDNSGLIDGAKLLQRAAREAQQRKETEKKLEAKAEKKRNDKLSTSGVKAGSEGKTGENGKDSKGNPLFGAPITQPKIEKKPATRLKTNSILLRPDGPPVDFNGSLISAARNTNGFSSEIYWNEGFFNDGSTLTQILPKYLETGGPNGAPAIEIEPLRLVTPPGGWDTEFQVPYPRDPTSRGKAGVKDATLEFFAKFSEDFVQFSNPQFIYITIGPNLFSISLYLTWDTFPNRLICEIDVSVKRGYFYSSQDVYTFNGELNNAPIQKGVWHHFALIKKTAPEGSYIYFCIDGEILSSLTVNWRESIYGVAYPGAYEGDWLLMGIGQDGGNGFAGGPQSVYVHGVRFAEKALYRPPFTPPLSL